MRVVYLTVDQVLDYHEQVLAFAGGRQGLRSEHLLASAVFQPQQTAFGDDAYATIPEKAAAYGFSLAENQPFIEGNKRTAALTMLAFLKLNGHDFHQTDEEIEEMFVSLGAGDIGQGEFTGWVCNHARPKPPR